MKTLLKRKIYRHCPIKKDFKRWKNLKECTFTILKEKPLTINESPLTLGPIRKIMRQARSTWPDKINKTILSKDQLFNLHRRKESSILQCIQTIHFLGLKFLYTHFCRQQKIQHLGRWQKRIRVVCFLKPPFKHQIKRKPFATMQIQTVQVQADKVQSANWRRNFSAWSE